MFNVNLKTIRKSKGLSQEELAIRLNVVRQTISKWEKGLSVPDAEMLIRIAEVFETSVSELLGAKMLDKADTNGVAEQLSRINEQLAIKNRRSKLIWKFIVGIIIATIVFNVLLAVVGIVSFNSFQNNKRVKTTTQSQIILPKE
ncbi:helix-turn-helix domain-containing protein [Candidatus Clostridium radicumherbarum]|jgi:Predicted transcriptional regulators|uniref:Helix-turn-helix domain-containing protein n=1 Tax=Candidatus Clostridium radicumherbarum TaxID=3381662 RepID=A0ABW8TVH2_9CLOT